MKKSLLTGRGFGIIMGIKIKVLNFVLLVGMVLVPGCSDSPVSPGNPGGFEFLDTARFEWIQHEIWGAGVFYMPSIHILNENDWFVYESNGNIWRPWLYLITDNGYREIYFEPQSPIVLNTIPGKGTFLFTYLNYSSTKIKVWKWNGFKFEFQKEYDYNVISNGTIVSYNYVDHNGYLWFTSLKNKVFRFDGEELNVYSLYEEFEHNDVIGETDFAYNGTDKLRIFGRKANISQPGPPWEFTWFIFRFENDNWTLEHEEFIHIDAMENPVHFDPELMMGTNFNSGDDITFTKYTKIGDQILRYQKDILQVYNNAAGFNTFMVFKVADINIDPIWPRGIEGAGLNDFMIPLKRRISPGNFRLRLYYFDGNKFSPEILRVFWGTKLEIRNDKIYRAQSDFPLLTIQIGRRK